VILLTRLGGPVFALNQDMIERADCTPDTVITLVDGTKYVVTESLLELVELIRHFRGSVITEAQWLEREPSGPGIAAVAAAPSGTAMPPVATLPSGTTPPSAAENGQSAAVLPLHRRKP
jgi:flagellar protein FlbD